MAASDRLATFHFTIDWNADGDVSDALEDISAYVQSAQWRLGMHQPWQRTADETTCTLTLVNVDRRFSPEYAAGPLYGALKPQRRIQIDAGGDAVTDASGAAVVDSLGAPVVTQTRTLWTGWIAAIAPAPMQHAGPFLTTIQGVGAAQFLKAQPLDLALLENVRAEDILQAIFARATYPPSALGGNAHAIGVPGRAEIGITTYVGSKAAFYELDDGLNEYPYAGDNWDKFASAYDGLVAVALAEYGRLFFGRDGRAVFWNRHHVQLDGPWLAEVDDTMQGLGYSYGDDVVNDARVTVYPRALSATATETLWALDEPLVLKGGETREVKATYAAADGQQVAGRNVATPNTGDGSLVVSHGSATITKFRAEARSATITLKNSSSGRDATIATLIVKGQKLTSWNAQQAVKIDPVSIADYGRQAERIDARLLTDLTVGQSIAHHLIHERAAPRGVVRALRFKNRDAATLATMLEATVGHRVRVQETQTATDGRYVVVGETHDWRDNGRDYTATLSLEPEPAVQAHQIGVPGRAEIGVTTYVGF